MGSTTTPTKYTARIKGIVTVFSTPTHIELPHLTQYLENNIMKDLPETANEATLHEHNPTKQENAETLNTNFIQFMSTLTPLLQDYEYQVRCKRKLTEYSSPTHNDINTEYKDRKSNIKLPYVFKVPTKSRKTVFDKHWKDHYDELTEFKMKFGHCNASRTTRGYDQLGNWLADQRKKLRRGKMTREQFDMLTELGMAL